MKLKKIGIVGCGTIGSKIAEAITQDFKQSAKLSALFDIDLNKADKLAGVLNKKNIVVPNLKALIGKADLVVEAASAKVSADVAIQTLGNNRDCLILSVGGLLNREDIFTLAKKKNRSIYIPSGAIAGIDALKAHKLCGIKKVTLITRKSPQALKGAPYITQNKIDLDNIKEETQVFEGSALQAVSSFPQNINVAATLSLAGIGKEKTRVKIVCSPSYSGNTHEIEIESAAGKTFVRCENNPAPENPKTSYLAILSAIAALRQIFEPVKIGT